MNNFSQDVQENLKYYVYRLIDPRDGSTFYIGKGSGNRVFSHLTNSLTFEKDSEDDFSAKTKTIRQIINSGLSPWHIIHRHGLSEETAIEVEAALIDAFPGLTNLISGHGSTSRGPASAEQLVKQYTLPQMQIESNIKVMAINISRSLEENERSLYNSVRVAWKISADRANRADYIFAVTSGICREVFVATGPWLPANAQNFPDVLDQDIVGRYGFNGEIASKKDRALYLNKRLPESMRRKKGMAAPILYNFK